MENKTYWWESEQNKTFMKIPISLTKSNDTFTACTNKDSEKYLGKDLTGIGNGKTEEEAIYELFKTIRLTNDFYKRKYLKYRCYVPLILGSWDGPATHWFTIFGIHFYFRYGKNNKHGWYVPFTKLNITISNFWKIKE